MTRPFALASFVVLLAGCPGPSTPGGDAGLDAAGSSDAGDGGASDGGDAAIGPGTDGGGLVDSAVDGGGGGADTGLDGGSGSDTGSGGVDADVDAATDAFVSGDGSPEIDSALDGGRDAAIDGGTDAARADAYAAACRNSIHDVGELCFFSSTIVRSLDTFVLSDVQIGDLNGDLFPDVVFGDDTSPSGVLGALVHQTGGSYVTTMLDVAVGPADIALGDVDGSGLDAVLGHTRTSAVTSAHGLNSGSFTLTHTYTRTDLAGAVTLGHLDSNTRLDLLETTQHMAVRVSSGAGDGTFGAPMDVATTCIPTRVAIADARGDGLADLFVGGTRSGGLGEIDVIGRMGDLTFAGGVTFTLGSTLNAMAVGDVNRDGAMDVVWGGQSGVALVRSGGTSGTGYDVLPAFDATFNVYDVELADLDDDGDLDVIASGLGSAAVLRIYLNDGTGTFGAPTPVPVSDTPRRIAAGDLNHDGAIDLALVLSGATDHGIALVMQEP